MNSGLMGFPTRDRLVARLCRAELTLSASLSVPNITTTPIPFDVLVQQTHHGQWNPNWLTHRLFAMYDGYYEAGLIGSWDANAAGMRVVQLGGDASDRVNLPPVTGEHTSFSVTFPIYLMRGRSVFINLYQDSSGTRTLVRNPAFHGAVSPRFWLEYRGDVW